MITLKLGISTFGVAGFCMFIGGAFLFFFIFLNDGGDFAFTGGFFIFGGGWDFFILLGGVIFFGGVFLFVLKLDPVPFLMEGFCLFVSFSENKNSVPTRKQYCVREVYTVWLCWCTNPSRL